MKLLVHCHISINYATVIKLCLIHLGYTGIHCTSHVDECESFPCMHDGRCIGGIGVHVCDCNNTGYRGTVCEIGLYMYVIVITLDIKALYVR